MKKFVVGTLTHSEVSADPRDLKADEVLPTPTDTELKNLPDSFDQSMYVGATYYQNGWGSCTALGTTHSMLIQNTKETQVDNPTLLPTIVADLKAGVNSIFLDRKDLRVKMGHDLNNTKDSGDYAEKAMLTAIKSGIKGTDIDGKEFVFFGKNYCYKRAGITDLDIAYVKYYLTKYPIVDVFLGDNNTWLEMSKGEVKTILTPSQTTGGHCICRCGFDSYGVKYINSRSPNDPTKKRSVFNISRENYKLGVQSGMINWRYRQLFDKDDAIVDLELLKKTQLLTKSETAVLDTVSATYQDSGIPLQGSYSALADSIRKDLGIAKIDTTQDKKIANMVVSVLSYARQYVPSKYQTQFSSICDGIRKELL